MGMNVAQKVISAHLVDGRMVPGEQIGLRIDQTLTQDSTGTMAYLQLEAMGVDQVKTKRSVAYIDHNMLQQGFENADDHKYIQTVEMCIRDRVWTVDGVKRRVRAGMGRCQGSFCTPRVMEIIEEETGIPFSEITKNGKGSELITGKLKETEGGASHDFHHPGCAKTSLAPAHPCADAPFNAVHCPHRYRCVKRPADLTFCNGLAAAYHPRVGWILADQRLPLFQMCIRDSICA